MLDNRKKKFAIGLLPLVIGLYLRANVVNTLWFYLRKPGAFNAAAWSGGWNNE